MHNKIEQEKNTQKDVYKLKHLNIKEIKTFCIREEKKQQDYFHKKNKVKTQKIILIAKAKEKKEKEKNKIKQKAILELENV